MNGMKLLYKKRDPRITGSKAVYNHRLTVLINTLEGDISSHIS